MKTIKHHGLFLLFILTLLFFAPLSDSYALDIKREVLDNGLTLLIVERHNLPMVTVTLGVKAGNLVEPEDKSGLANLTASLLSEGTAKRTGRQISEEIEFVGGSLGASGGSDYATVNLSVLKKDISLGFNLLSDVILNPSFTDDEIKKKVKKIKGSLKAGEEDPSFVASKAFMKEVFGNHPYGRLVQGSEACLDSIKRDDIVEFHKSYYTPDNSIMSVVGDITPGEVKALLDQYFSAWQMKRINPPSLPELTHARKKTIIIDKELTQANIVLGHLGVERSNPDYYAVSVMNYILGGGGFASRLMQNVREEKGLVYDISSFFSANRIGGAFEVSLQTKNESANEAIEEILKEIKKIRSEPVSEKELSDAKAFLTGSFPMRIETGARIANFLIAVEYYGLGMGYADKYPSYINGITREDVLRAAEKYLDPDNYVLVVVADEKKTALKDEFR
jgi:zinc protease